MVLTKSEKKELDKIREVIKGTPVKVKRVGPANVIISGVGSRVVSQLGSNIGVSALEVALAKVKVWAKRKRGKL